MSPRTSAQPGGHPNRSGLALAGTIGGYVALCILVGVGLGVLLDQVFGAGPLFLIAGAVLGFIASFYLTYRVAMGELGD